MVKFIFLKLFGRQLYLPLIVLYMGHMIQRACQRLRDPGAPTRIAGRHRAKRLCYYWCPV